MGEIMVDSRELATFDAIAMAEKVRQKEVTPSELVEVVIERIERINPKINAVITPMFKEARRIAKGKLPKGPFTGVPFLLKDVLAMKTWRRSNRHKQVDAKQFIEFLQ